MCYFFYFPFIYFFTICEFHSNRDCTRCFFYIVFVLFAISLNEKHEMRHDCVMSSMKFIQCFPSSCSLQFIFRFYSYLFSISIYVLCCVCAWECDFFFFMFHSFFIWNQMIKKNKKRKNSSVSSSRLMRSVSIYI